MDPVIEAEYIVALAAFDVCMERLRDLLDADEKRQHHQ